MPLIAADFYRFTYSKLLLYAVTAMFAQAKPRVLLSIAVKLEKYILGKANIQVRQFS